MKEYYNYYYYHTEIYISDSVIDLEKLEKKANIRSQYY